MAGLQQDSRIAARLVGPVEIGGDVEARQTFEDHLLDGVAFGLDAAGDCGIQRTVVLGQAADEREERLAHELFPAFGIGDSADFGDGIFALL